MPINNMVSKKTSEMSDGNYALDQGEIGNH